MTYLTKQEIFDKVSAHLLKQGTRCYNTNRQTVDEPGDLLRSSDGTSSAIGCLIAPEKYLPEHEKMTLADLIEQGILPVDPTCLKMFGVTEYDLLLELDYIHDMAHLEDWEDEMRESARLFGLTCKF